MASGMGTGPAPGQGSWPSPPQQQPLLPGQYPAPQYPGQPQPPAGPGLYAPGGARFPVAEPFDGVNPDGTPRIVRAQLDPREIPALTTYLTQAPVVLAAPGNAQDELVPAAGQVIPRAFHSDGVWVWPAAVGYYLGCYQLPPSDALLAHIRMRNYQLGFVAQETRSAAAAELMAILNAPAAPAPAPPVLPAPQPMQNQPLIPPPLAPQAAVNGPILSAQTVAAREAQASLAQSPAPQLPALPSPTVTPDPVPATMLASMAEPAVEEAEAEATSPMTPEELAAALEASAVTAKPAESGALNIWSVDAESNESESVESKSESAASVESTSAAEVDQAAQEPEQSSDDDDMYSAPTVLHASAASSAPAAETEQPARDDEQSSDDEDFAATVLSTSAASSAEAAEASASSDSAARDELAETSGPAGPTMVFSAAEAMAQWSSLDSSLPQAEPPLAPERFGPEFSATGNKHAAWVSEQLEAFTAYMPTGDWSVDHKTRSYAQSERSLVVDGLGTLSPEGIWTWAWSDFGGWDQDSGILDQSRVLRGLAEQAGIAELTAGSLDLTGVGDAEDPATAAEMLAWTAMGLLGARGYIGHGSSTGGRIYYLVTDPSVPRAEPSLVQIPRHLFEGTQTFGENALECVIGYAEHHGWEWNRTPIGIGVAATGVGSFAVEIVEDRLVGLSLHI